MRKQRMLALVGLVLCSSLLGGAQVRASDIECPDYCIWARQDILLWRVKDAPIPTLVTSGSQAKAGVLGDPSTGILLGDSISHGTLSGLRLTLGVWFDSDGVFGAEGSGFLLEPHTTSSSFVGDISGNPILSIPFFDTTKGESVLPISNPRNGAGSIFVNESIKLYGGDLAFLITGCRTSCNEVNYLIGFKGLYLNETLNVSSTTTPFAGGGSTLFRSDNFTTRNFFYGGQLGVRTIRRSDIWFFALTGKVAVGSTFEVVEIAGQTTTVPKLGVTTVGSGAFFAQPSNIGRYATNQLSVVPEVQAQLGLDISSHLKLSVGYDFLYMSNVARPGSQVDRQIGPAAGGVTHPFFDVGRISSSSFFAHGANVGVELRF